MTNEKDQDVSQSTSKKKVKKKSKKSHPVITGIKIFVLCLFLLGLLGASAVGGLIYATVKTVPDVDFTTIVDGLNQRSLIVDQNGNELEEILTQEFRDVVPFDQISDHMKHAIISIEDERFYTHMGVDLQGILSALIDDIKAGAVVRGASTINQQLVKNVFLADEVDRDNLMKDVQRKIKEAYLSIEMQKVLTKDQILNAYLNTVYFGQNAYGVQSAARVYFSKDAKDLTAAEAAMIAGATKNPAKRALFMRISPEKYNDSMGPIVGEIEVIGKRYLAVFNEAAQERQKTILAMMRKHDYLTEAEYQEALNQDMVESLHIGEVFRDSVETTYFNDYVKTQVVKDLMKKNDMTREQAQNLLYNGGLTIYSTVDTTLQSKVEGIYNEFTKNILDAVNTKLENVKGAALVLRKMKNKNIIEEKTGKIAFYEKQNIFDQEHNLIIEKGTYRVESNGDLVIKNNKIQTNFDIKPYYEVDENKNLITYPAGYLFYFEDRLKADKEKKEIIVFGDFLKKNPDFYKTDAKGNLLIKKDYFKYSEEGIIQPQSAMVLLDHKTGQIKAMMGGRDIKGSRLLNRATDSPRQPGSSIKPIAVYVPALDNGFTAATAIDDVPFRDGKGRIWPKNYNNRYSGLVTLREAVMDSKNVCSVKTLQSIGIDTSVEYLKRFHVIEADNPKEDSFMSLEEAKALKTGNFDENLAALGLGGMTRGITPLRMTAAFGSIANKGVYVEPIAYSKVLDKNGDVLLERIPTTNQVVDSKVAYLMTDILKSVIGPGGTGKRAKLKQNIAVAGKTGTTQNKADVWFVGYTPYYSCAVWIGNDSPAIKLDSTSRYAASLWKYVMEAVHEGLPDKSFDSETGFIRKSVCKESGKLASKLCSRDPRGSQVISELFIKGTEPKEYCDVHTTAIVDVTTNLLSNEFCPSDKVQQKVFIKRNPPYIPENNAGIIPGDYKYTVPTKYCDVHTKSESLEDLDIIFGNEENNSTQETPSTDDNSMPDLSIPE